ncbi:radical SAM protein [Treponema sp.]|uniref:radical SAM protein n=1 Tax=Treponema sp. TaxID=166 RepID=UPI0025F6DFF6|nr:radical SAM protein [Treponema sp.]MCR5217264.1 radical SAM protein [Treponema sp.]
MCESLYRECRQCPRKCGSDRTKNKGFCTQDSGLVIASACLHFGEEPLITVHGGSGTIFLTGCTLKCSFCQNYQISQQGMGAKADRDTFVKMCLKLQEKGAENINLVTPSHHIPLLAEYIAEAKSRGVSIPFAWNSSAYESEEMLDLVKGLVDIYLPDLKTLNPIMSRELFAAENYPQAAKRAIRKMMENAPLNIVEKEKNGEVKEKMLSGVIIRHLVLPGRMDDSRMVLDWLKGHADGKACISLMNQYTPVPFTGPEDELTRRKKSLEAFSNRLVSKEEDKTIQQWIDSYEFEYLFYQELSDDTSWLPDFNRTQPFSNALAKPVWHWRDGFID